MLCTELVLFRVLLLQPYLESSLRPTLEQVVVDVL